jgi:polysaccharide biosynthesis protein PslJ
MTIVPFALLILVALVGLFAIRSDRDAVAVLTIFLVALFGITARWVIPGTGAIGTPAMVIAFAAAWWWWMTRVNPNLSSDADPNPIRVILLGYLWFVALSWGLGRLRLLSTLEVNGSNRALLTAVGLTGVALVVSDGVRSRLRLETLLRRVVVGGGVLSVVGLLQFFADIDLVAGFQIPGLVPNGEAIQALATRSDLSRAEGTALHSIEFSAVLAMILPLAIHFAMNGRDPRERRRYAVMTAIIGIAIPLSVSRTGILAAAVALVVTAIAWNWRQRIIGLATAGVAAIALGVVVPGLIGTFRWLIFGASEDPSVTARLDRVPLVMEQVSERPWLGWGIGTFSPDEDFLLDNQYFGTLIETGVVGLLIVVALILTAMTLCYLTFRHSQDDDTRYLATAIMAGVAVLPVVMYLFDAFFYSILMGVSFLLIGSAGALWRLAVRDTRRREILEPYEAYSPPVLRRQPEAGRSLGRGADGSQPTAVIERTTQCERVYSDGRRCPNQWVTSEHRRDKRFCSGTCRSAVRYAQKVKG